MQKTITTDFIEKTRIKNDGSVPQYYVKDSQEAIIPRDIFTQVQEEMLRRANMFSGEKSMKKRVYSSKYALSSICTCSKCGDIYRRVAWNIRGKQSVVWRCCTRVENGPSACDAATVSDQELQQVTVQAINCLLKGKSGVLDVLMENINIALAEDNSEELEKINAVITEKQKLLLELVHAKKDYSQIADEIDLLYTKKQELLVEKANTEGHKIRIKELEKFLRQEKQEFTDYDEIMVRKYINRIKIYDDKFIISFKAGIDLEFKR